MADAKACTFVLCHFLIFSLKVIQGAKELKDLQIIIEDKPHDCQEYSRSGDIVHVHYTGMLPDGHIFDTSMRENRSPFIFQLGSGNVIKGWERGILGMCPGEKRKLVIPSHLGYGKHGIEGVIPPDSTLLFQVHLAALERQSSLQRVEKFLNFAIYPAGVLMLLYYLYKKITNSDEQERKADKRMNKKKR